jgi:hypothetical protein
LSEQLQTPPPGQLPCATTLLLGLSEYVVKELGDVLGNDLVYASTSRWNVPYDDKSKLAVLNSIDR